VNRTSQSGKREMFVIFYLFGSIYQWGLVLLTRIMTPQGCIPAEPKNPRSTTHGGIVVVAMRNRMLRIGAVARSSLNLQLGFPHMRKDTRTGKITNTMTMINVTRATHEKPLRSLLSAMS
jgi:hypothetical protein